MSTKPIDLVNQCNKSLQSYQETAPHIKSVVRSNDLKTIKEVISQIKKIIKDRKCTPSQKLLTLELFNDCLMLRIPNFLNYAQEKILDRLRILAAKKPIDLFRDSNKSQLNLQTSEDFINRLLKYIQIWAHNFGKGVGGQSTFYGTIYVQLQGKVKFPPLSRKESFNSEPSRSEEAKGRQSARVEETKIRQPVAAGRVTTSTPIQPVKSDKETLEYLDNVLVIIEEIDNPTESETGKELLETVKGLKGSLDEILNKALNKDDSTEIERVLNISERIQKVLQGGNRKSLYSTTTPRYEERPAVPYEPRYENSYKQKDLKAELNYSGRYEEKFPVKKEQSGYSYEEPPRGSIPKLEEKKIAPPSKLEVKIEKKPEEKKSETPAKEPVNIFDDILSLDIDPITSPPPKAMFNSMQPNFPSLFSPFVGMNGTNSFPQSPPFEPPSTDRENLLKEKDETIEVLKQQILVLKAQNEALERSLKITKELLLSKEKECEEFHVFKAESVNFQDHKEVQNPVFEPPKQGFKDSVAENPVFENAKPQFQDFKDSSQVFDGKFQVFTPELNNDIFANFESLLSKPQKPKLEIPAEPAADNESIFKAVVCEEMAVLYDSVLFQVGYQLKLGQNSVSLTCYLTNKSNSLIQNTKLKVQNPGFSVTLEPESFLEVKTGSQIFFKILVNSFEINSSYPRLIITCLQGSDKYEVNLKLPINIFQFASPISINPVRLWQEWEDLLFAGENFNAKSKNAKNNVPKLLRLGKNLMVIGSEELQQLASREFMVAGELGGLVLAVVKVKRKEGEVDVEVRSNDPRLREHFMKLLVSNLAD